jgi:peroxiredoxin
VNGDRTGKVFLSELDINRVNLLDSAIISSDGSFSIDCKCDSTSVYALQIGEEQVITLIVQGGDSIHIEAVSGSKPFEYSVRGNEESMLMAIFEQHSNRNLHEIDSLRILFEQSRDDPGFFAIRSLIDQAYQEILIDQRLFARKFIEEHPGSLASLVALNRNFKQIELFDKIEDYSYYTLIDSSLFLKYPGNKHWEKHHEITLKILEKIEKDEVAAGKLSPGNLAPDIKLKGWNGQDYQLSELQGNWVIVYFWAAWDARSRQVNHELRALYSIHQDKGLEIFAISLDENEKVWKAAIKLDELNCIQVSDLKSLHSPVIPLFRVPDKLPYFYLLDRQGIIVWKGHNLGELEELLMLNLNEIS